MKKTEVRKIAERNCGGLPDEYDPQFHCEYTGWRLDLHNATVDHVLPRSLGGEDNAENGVICHKWVNDIKGQRSVEELDNLALSWCLHRRLCQAATDRGQDILDKFADSHRQPTEAKLRPADGSQLPLFSEN